MILGLVTIVLPGCNTIRHGTKQIITINSIPEGASVKIQPGSQVLETPGSIFLSRRHPYSMVVSKDGFRSESIMIQSKSKGLWRNLIWLHPAGWIIGGIVDLSNGSARELEPSEV
jgi:hypothetical protein